MKRIFLAILLLVLAVLLIPALRERAQPGIDASRTWMGEKLEGPMSPILTPYRTLRTQTRMGEAGRLLVRDRNRGRRPPTPEEFPDYLTRNNVELLDYWGAPLIIEQEPDSLAIISPGPDLEYRTDDDVVTKIRYAAPQYRFRRR